MSIPAYGGAALAAPPVIAVPSATGVEARIVLAGPGARAMAFVIDWLIRSSAAALYLVVASMVLLGNLNFTFTDDTQGTWYLLGVVPATAIYFLYHLVLEPLTAGRTPGKRMVGLRVLTPEGIAPSTGALFTRNLFRIVDSMPVFYVVGLLFVMFGRRHVRLGDLAAGTVLAVDRAPFLESLGTAEAAWQPARERAARLGRRHGSEVGDALATVSAYRALAREVGAARDHDVRAEYLEATYADLHDAIHRPARKTGETLIALFRDEVPAAMRAMRVHLTVVTLLFIVSIVAGYWMIYAYPDLVAMFASPNLISTVERGELWTDGLLNVTPSSVLSVKILTNNIIVSIFAFASGVVFGLGTLYLIGLNGISLGAIFAFTGQHGLDGRLFDFVVAHGCVELSCICIAGAAGAYLGEALVRPGAQSRAESFRHAAGLGLRVMLASTVLLLICGFIEGYVSPDPEVPRWARVVVGVGYWLFMISFLRGYVFGRSRSVSNAPSAPQL